MPKRQVILGNGSVVCLCGVRKISGVEETEVEEGEKVGVILRTLYVNNNTVKC